MFRKQRPITNNALFAYKILRAVQKLLQEEKARTHPDKQSVQRLKENVKLAQSKAAEADAAEKPVFIKKQQRLKENSPLAAAYEDLESSFDKIVALAMSAMSKR